MNFGIDRQGKADIFHSDSVCFPLRHFTLPINIGIPKRLRAVSPFSRSSLTLPGHRRGRPRAA